MGGLDSQENHALGPTLRATPTRLQILAHGVRKANTHLSQPPQLPSPCLVHPNWVHHAAMHGFLWPLVLICK